MTHSFEIPWECPHCRKTTDIFVEYESNSDYYPCLECEHCNKEIKDDALDIILSQEVFEYIVARTEYYKD
jgi:hypothetical protein